MANTDLRSDFAFDCLFPAVSANRESRTEELYPHIIKGEDTPITDFPFVCLLERGGSFICSCVLVKPNRVLTAAHCVEGASVKDLSVVLGLQNIPNKEIEINEGDAIRVGIARAVKHPLYISNNAPANDIAVLHLDKAVEMSERIQPIEKLASPVETFLLNKECYIIGYGVVAVNSDNSRVSATELQAANIRVIPYPICLLKIPVVLPNQICVHNFFFKEASCSVSIHNRSEVR
ncbi:hypothetical protein ScPMuIL_008324 [Solemya velum]